MPYLTRLKEIVGFEPTTSAQKQLQAQEKGEALGAFSTGGAPTEAMSNSASCLMYSLTQMVIESSWLSTMANCVLCVTRTTCASRSRSDDIALTQKPNLPPKYGTLTTSPTVSGTDSRGCRPRRTQNRRSSLVSRLQ